MRYSNQMLTTSQVLGMIQNMSTFTCPHCHKNTPIFGSSGVERECTKLGIDLLGDIPLHRSICDDADRGKPTVVSEPDSDRTRTFTRIAEAVAEKIQL
jgi:ATP-binding protein involved in chromosome partitioning